MTEKTENRIWRGLFLAVIAGVGIAATSQTASPKAVSMIDRDGGGGITVLLDNGSLYNMKPVYKDGRFAGTKWDQFYGPITP